MPVLTKSVIRKIKSLRVKKYRDEYNLFVAEGVKMVAEIQSSALKIDSVYAIKSWIASNLEIPAVEVNAKELSRLSSLKTPNQVLCVVEIPQYSFDIENLRGLSLVLDNISDPGNMGTILRTADWFGIENIFCSENSVNVYNPKVVQASMGSVSRVKIHYLGLKSFLQSCANKYPVYGMVMDGKSIYEEQFKGDALLVIGNESEGISADIESLLTKKIGIPSFGSAESLNAAVATAIACFEYKRVL